VRFLRAGLSDPVSQCAAVCAPVVVAYHFVTRASELAFLVLVLNLGVGVFASYMLCRFANRRRYRVAVSRLVVGSVIAGILFTTTQYAVAPELGGFALWEPFRSSGLGGGGNGRLLGA